MHLSLKLFMRSYLKLEYWLESHLNGRWLSPKNALFNGKIPFLCLANTGVKPPFFKLAGLNYKSYWDQGGQVKRKVNCGELSHELTLLGLPHIMKGCLWSMIVKSPCKNEFQLYAVFLTRDLLNNKSRMNSVLSNLETGKII